MMNSYEYNCEGNAFQATIIGRSVNKGKTILYIYIYEQEDFMSLVKGSGEQLGLQIHCMLHCDRWRGNLTAHHPHSVPGQNFLWHIGKS